MLSAWYCDKTATCSALSISCTIDFRGGRNGVLSKIDCYTRPCWPIDTKLSEMIVHMSLVIRPGITQKWPKDVLCPFLSWLPRRFITFLIRSPSIEDQQGDEEFVWRDRTLFQKRMR